MAQAPWWPDMVAIAPTLVYDLKASHDIETDPDWRTRWAGVTVSTIVFSGDKTLPGLPEAATPSPQHYRTRNAVCFPVKAMAPSQKSSTRTRRLLTAHRRPVSRGVRHRRPCVIGRRSSGGPIKRTLLNHPNRAPSLDATVDDA